MLTTSLNVTPKTTEQHLIARSDKSVAYVTNNKRLRSTFCTMKANYWQTRSIARLLCDSRATCTYISVSSNYTFAKFHVCISNGCNAIGQIRFFWLGNIAKLLLWKLWKLRSPNFDEYSWRQYAWNDATLRAVTLWVPPKLPKTGILGAWIGLRLSSLNEKKLKTFVH